MPETVDYVLNPIGFIRSSIQTRKDAPDAWLEVKDEFVQALQGVSIGDELILITWFHLSSRDTLAVHPRGDRRNPLTGVFATRSPDRPNPLGLHRVKVLELTGTRIKVGPIEALDGTPVVDIKPVLDGSADF